MPERFVIFTTNMETVRFVRQNDETGSFFYFVSTSADFIKALESFTVLKVLLDGEKIEHELEELLTEKEILFTEYSEDVVREILSGRKSGEDFFHEARALSPSFSKIQGKSSAIQKLKKNIIKFAGNDFPVLITGETGTGKTLVANAIHELSSRRKNKILEVNVTEIPESLFESILFGHEKGAFSGAEEKHRGFWEMADKTTLFLDEIGELPLNLQAKLLRVISKNEFYPAGANKSISSDVRLIFATNANLQQKIHDGLFRADLYRRIKNLTLEIPPLREHKEDIPELVYLYLESIGCTKKLSQGAMELLKNCSWEENIGQMENCLNRAVVFCEGPVIETSHIHF